VRLVHFIISIYHDARSPERQIRKIFPWYSLRRLTRLLGRVRLFVCLQRRELTVAHSRLALCNQVNGRVYPGASTVAM
jgi:hypothetical protein